MQFVYIMKISVKCYLKEGIKWYTVQLAEMYDIEAID